MSNRVPMLVFFLLFAVCISANQPTEFNTKWIPEKPEVLTYKSSSPQGNGFYQVSLFRKDSVIIFYTNIITTGYTKTITGRMDSTFQPISSDSKIFVDKQICLETSVRYNPSSLRIETLMIPYNRTMEAALPLTNFVVDFSQIPLLPRTLNFTRTAKFTFNSLNPQTNQLIPLTLSVVGEEKISDTECYKVESTDFEGKSYFWIQKDHPHIIIRIEQPETSRITELIR